MPRGDGTGPFWGFGPGTGRRMGFCPFGLNRGLFGRGYRRQWTKKDELTALSQEESLLEKELKAVRQQKQQLQGQK